MGPISETAMAVPEIAAMIIKQIDEPRGLARAARVNKAWHEEAIKYLWKGFLTYRFDQDRDPVFKRWRTPDLDVLCDLAHKPVRFRHYIQHAKYLFLTWKNAHRASHDAWILPQANLWTTLSCVSLYLLNVHWANINPVPTIAFLLKPTLRGLELNDYLLSRQLMLGIVRILPNLVWLSINMEVGGVSQPDPELVPGFLAQMHRLKGIVIGDPVNSDIEIAVLRLPNLVVLHFHVEIARELKLQDIEIAAEALRSFVSRLPSLEVFEFVLNYAEGDRRVESEYDVSTDILLPLTNSKRLKKLVLHDPIEGEGERSVSMSALCRLCETCGLIERLHILFRRSTDTGLTSAIFRHFVKYLPRLEVLQLEYPMEVKVEDVTALAQGCPNLRSIGPYQILNTSVLEDMPAGIVFPRVENLLAREMNQAALNLHGGTAPDTASQVPRFLNLLQQRLPSLRRLWVQRWLDEEAHDQDIDMNGVEIYGEDVELDPILYHGEGWPALELDRPSREMKLEVLGLD